MFRAPHHRHLCPPDVSLESVQDVREPVAFLTEVFTADRARVPVLEPVKLQKKINQSVLAAEVFF